MNIKAKFKCTSHSIQNVGTSYEQAIITMNPVVTGSEENKSFSKATPSGLLTLTISKDTSAFNAFKQNQEYYLIFEEA